MDAERVREPWFAGLRERFEYHVGIGPSWVTKQEGLALVEVAEAARSFAKHVLDCDSYGCENGPSKCLHADAKRQLELIAAAASSQAVPDE